MQTLYCRKCQKGTEHYRREPVGFFTQLVIATITKFSVDLRTHDYECCECGTRRDA